MVDEIDKKILAALDRNARMTTVMLAETVGIARATAQARLEKLETSGALAPHSVRLRLPAAGLPLRAIVMAQVDQDDFDETTAALLRIDEVIECLGISGRDDLLIQVGARSPEDLYDISQRIMRCPGIRRTATSTVLREFIAYRTLGTL